MTGAMYSAIAGLKTHMSKLNVIGNNVANANTYGYKSARTVFSESIYNSVRNGSNGSLTMGGVNPSQLGFGCTIGTIDLDMGTQSYVPTGRGLDTMIFGDGFFFVGAKPEMVLGEEGTYSLKETDPSSLLLTRVGNFNIDPEGYLVDGNGYVVYGFVTCAGLADDDGNVEPSATAGLADKYAPAVSTQLVPIRLPLAAAKPTDPDGIPEGTPIFPGIGEVDGALYDENSKYNIYDTGDADSSITSGKTITVNADSIKLDGQSGKLSCVLESGDQIVIGYIPLAQVTNVNGLTHMQGPYFMALEGAGQCTVASIGNAMDGRFLNNADGTVDAHAKIFSTGDTKCITGGLESSGTDIATEFSEMITTQRGYQANTRIVTVTDSMLEELVNMKR